MLPEGEDLNEWIAVNSKSWERGTCPSVEGNLQTPWGLSSAEPRAVKSGHGGPAEGRSLLCYPKPSGFRCCPFVTSLRSLAAVDFFNQINMLYGTITEFCTESSCPVMSAGPRYGAGA